MASVHALYLPGLSGQYASAPDSAALSITSDVDIRALVAPDDWTPAAGSALVAKWNATGNQKSYMLQILADGTLRLGLSGVGSDSNFGISSSATGFTDGTKKWVRATWRNSDNRVQFFTADGSIASPVTADWTQLGTNQTINLTGLFDSTALLEVGSNSAGTGTPFAGFVYHAQVRNNVLDDGTGIVYDADFSSVAVTATRTPTSFTESSSNAATVTVNGTAAWTWTGGSLSLPALSGQYASAPDSVPLSITGDLTLLVRVALDDWTPGAFQSLLGKWNNAAKSYNLGVSNNAPAGKLQLSISTDGTTTVAAVSTAAPTVSDGGALWVLASRRKSDGRVQFFTADGSIASPAASDFTQLGADVTGISAGTNLFDSTTVVEVGSLNVGTASMASGKFYRAMIYDGVFATSGFGGTKQFDSAFTSVAYTGPHAPTSFTESSANGATVTLNGSAAWYWYTTASQSCSDTAAATESLSRTVVFTRSSADTAAATETASRALAQARSSADTAAATETATRALVESRTATDTAAATDAAARALTQVRSAADTAAAVDAAVRSLVQTRAATDTAAATDSASRTAADARTGSDTAAATDTAARSLAQTRTATDTAPAADTATRSLVQSRTVTDTATATDSTARALAEQRSSADTAAATDTAARQLAAARTSTDTAPASDVADAVGTAARTATDGSPAADTADGTTSAARSSSDAAPAAETASGERDADRSAADVAAAQDASRGSIVLTRSSADTAAAVDDVQRAAAALARTATDAARAEDDAASGHVIQGSAADDAPAVETASRALVQARSSADVAGAVESTAGLVVQTRSASDLAAATETASRLLLAARFGTDAAPAVDLAATVDRLLRSVHDDAPATDVAVVKITLPPIVEAIAGELLNRWRAGPLADRWFAAELLPGRWRVDVLADRWDVGRIVSKVEAGS